MLLDTTGFQDYGTLEEKRLVRIFREIGRVPFGLAVEMPHVVFSRGNNPYLGNILLLDICVIVLLNQPHSCGWQEGFYEWNGLSHCQSYGGKVCGT